MNYRFDNGDWRILAGVNRSLSKGGIRDTTRGHFRQFAVALKFPVRVSFSDINAIRPANIRVFDNNNQEVDIYDIDNYRLATANSTPRHTKETINRANLDLRKQVPFLPVPTTVQVGGMHPIQTRDTRRESITWNYNGINGDQSPAPFLSPVYVNHENAFGFRNYPQISSTVGWQQYLRNPGLFTQTPAQIVAERNTALRNSEYIQEKVSALYSQAELKLFHGRLHVLGGVRYEKTTDEGRGALSDPAAVFVRNPDGTFARSAAGSRIRKPEAGAVGSLEELGLTLQERGFRVKRSYDGYYPSLHLIMNGTKLRLEGNQLASFREFIPESLNWGISFSRKPVLFMAKWNYRGRQTGSAQPAFGPDAFLHEQRRMTLDLNSEYQFRKEISFFANIQNVFNEPIITLIEGAVTPHYAKRSLTSISGTTITMGIKGSF